jgi:hypothetical protein
MDGMSGKYSIRETTLFITTMEDVSDGNPAVFRTAFEWLWEILETSPDRFPIVPMASPKNNIRVVKTEVYISASGVFPPLRILFSIEDNEYVVLRKIEKRRGFGLGD